MALLRNMDLYKAIVLLSVVLLPLGGWLIKGLDENIKACRTTLNEARRPGGIVEQIGGLQRKVEVVNLNNRSTKDAISAPGTYFEGQILAAGGSGIKVSDFNPKEPQEQGWTLGKSRVADYVVDIDWVRRDMVVTLEFVYAVLFNCESGARQAGDAAQQSVWKLRELQLVNVTNPAIGTKNDTPPPELEDKWQIRKMSFARREPRKGTGT
jgi:hypothetical protein